MAVTYEDVTPPIIANTIMQKRFIDGVFKVYTVKAAEGYVLHDAALDAPMYDEFGNPTFDENGNEVLVLGYTRGLCTCAASYDFVANPREFYAVPEDSVPADQIFGGGGEHEVMDNEEETETI